MPESGRPRRSSDGRRGDGPAGDRRGSGPGQGRGGSSGRPRGQGSSFGGSRGNSFGRSRSDGGSGSGYGRPRPDRGEEGRPRSDENRGSGYGRPRPDRGEGGYGRLRSDDGYSRARSDDTRGGGFGRSRSNDRPNRDSGGRGDTGYRGRSDSGYRRDRDDEFRGRGERTGNTGGFPRARGPRPDRDRGYPRDDARPRPADDSRGRRSDSYGRTDDRYDRTENRYGRSDNRYDRTDRGGGEWRRAGDGRPPRRQDDQQRRGGGYRNRSEGGFGGPRRGGADRGPRRDDDQRGPRRDSADRGPRRDSTDRGPRRYGEPRGPRREDERSGPPVNRNWGGVARRGARAVTSDEGTGSGPSASELWREAVARADSQKDGPAAWEPEETWVLEPEEPEEEPEPAGPRRATTNGPVERDLATGREGLPSPGGRRRKVPKPVVEELASAAGADRGAKLAQRMADATYAYEKERYQEARRILRTLIDEVPGSAAVHELYGLVLYRTGQWAAAAKQLESFRQMSGSYDQHPALADCYRALHRYDDADEVWNDLREASPSGDLVAEGRIVAAGCKADRGDLAGAILMLEKASRKVAKPQERHLRQWYVLADLYERAGDVPRSRDLFNRIASADPDAFDVKERLRALR